MIRKNEQAVMRAIVICFKPYLKPEEAMLYCNLARTQFSKKCEESGIYKNSMGYFKREDLDMMLAGKSNALTAGTKSKKAGGSIKIK